MKIDEDKKNKTVVTSSKYKTMIWDNNTHVEIRVSYNNRITERYTNRSMRFGTKLVTMSITNAVV